MPKQLTINVYRSRKSGHLVPEVKIEIFPEIETLVSPLSDLVKTKTIIAKHAITTGHLEDRVSTVVTVN